MRVILWSCALAGVLAGCYLGGVGGDAPPGADAGPDALGPLPFTADAPATYVAKVKNILVGLPPTDTEVAAVAADPTQLGVLVDGWMKQPEYATKMQRFFELAFQQTQVAPSDFIDQTFPIPIAPENNNSPPGPDLKLSQNLQESFARTMVAFAAQGIPFNQAMSTNQLMMTTAMKAYYAMADVFQVGNLVGCGLGAGSEQAFGIANPQIKSISVTATQIPLSETLDPSSPNYMVWYNPKFASSSQCPDPYPIAQAPDIGTPAALYDLLHGWLPGALSYTPCAYSYGAPWTPIIRDTDFSDWTMTTIVPASDPTKITHFYDVPALRTATQLTLSIPRVGFFTTPAFIANWPTNASNQMRVVMNQMFIVATNTAVDGTDPTMPPSTPGLDAKHASDPACEGCHRILDPSRLTLATTYSWNFGLQQDAKWQDAGAGGQLFAFQGEVQNVSSIYDVGKALANHPLLASGWTQKLCYYANAEACVTTDPEFERLAKLFQSSNYSWNALVKAVVTSPITTHAAPTVTATTNGEIVGVSRRDHLCAMWSARLGLANACLLDVSAPSPYPNNLSTFPSVIVPGLPSDGYSRGSAVPVQPNDPSVFFTGGIDNLCDTLAQLLIDDASPPPGAKTWSSANAAAAIPEFVTLVMGIEPSDARYATTVQLLTAHETAALAQVGATKALQSTFMVACVSAPAIGMGM
ncbi:MAG TPA: hypothetical protein VGH28_12560 [Polyangiaceae bacterium]|jgi:hypothetical protein